MDWMEIAHDLRDPLRAGDLDTCIEVVTRSLRELPISPYHLVLDVDFTNDPLEVARHFERFAEEAGKTGSQAAIYAEMNGFFINPDRWYFELFAIPTYGGHEDYDWLADWSALYGQDITLSGMESLQAVYERMKAADDSEHEPFTDANGICDLLVVLRFQNLIRRSAALMRHVHVPLLATAHEYDFIYEVILAGKAT